MKTLLKFWSVIIIIITTTSSLSLSQSQPGIEKLNLVVSNVCDYYGQYVVTNVPGSTSIVPSLGNAGCVNMSAYAHFDSLHISGDAKYLEVTDDYTTLNQQKLCYVASDNTILSYYSSFPVSYCDPLILPRDTFLIDSISGIAALPNRLFVIR